MLKWFLRCVESSEPVDGSKLQKPEKDVRNITSSAPWSPVLVLCSNLKEEKNRGGEAFYYFEYSKEILVSERKLNSLFELDESKIASTNNSSLLHLCLIYCLLVRYLDANVIKCIQSEHFVWWAQQRWCAAVSGLKRSGATVLSAPCAAVRAHLRLPPPASSVPSTENRDPGLFVILAERTPPWKQSRSPLEWLLAFTACSCLFNGDSRTLFHPKTGFFFPRRGSQRR